MATASPASPASPASSAAHVYTGKREKEEGVSVEEEEKKGARVAGSAARACPSLPWSMGGARTPESFSFHPTPRPAGPISATQMVHAPIETGDRQVSAPRRGGWRAGAARRRRRRRKRKLGERLRNERASARAPAQGTGLRRPSPGFRAPRQRRRLAPAATPPALNAPSARTVTISAIRATSRNRMLSRRMVKSLSGMSKKGGGGTGWRWRANQRG